MNFKYFSYSIEFVSIVFLLAMLFIIYSMMNIQNKITQSEANRFHSINLSNELFQSSEDLTRMARTYIATGNSAYEQHYFEILNIRNGVLVRPKNYGLTYWHLLPSARNKTTEPTPNNKAIPLRELMLLAHFSDSELKYLLLSQANSDKLVSIEKQAFSVMKGLYDNGQGKFTVPGTSNKDIALGLLFNDAYERAKGGIMMPIQLVIDSVEQRTTKELREYQNSLGVLIQVLWALIIASLVGVFLVFIYTSKKIIKPLEELSQLDPLTGLFNRRYFTQLAEGEFLRATRTERPLSILMLDIDFFKRVNDLYGHDIGDKALESLSNLLKNKLRKIDICCRWGGEEFLILLLETDKKTAFETSNRLRLSIEASVLQVKHKTPLRLTASIGVFTLNDKTTSLNAMIKEADKSLYHAKHTGRNKVCCI